MKSNNYIINAKPQENGLYGMPMLCIAYDRAPIFLSKELEVKSSAILLAIAEVEKKVHKGDAKCRVIARPKNGGVGFAPSVIWIDAVS